MKDTLTHAIIVAGVVASALVVHVQQIPAEAELGAAALAVAAALGGGFVGYSYADSRGEQLADLRDTVARIRTEQKRDGATERVEIDELKN